MRPPLHKLKLLVLVLLLVQGCSNANDSAVSVDVSGKHPSGWASSHGIAYLQDATACMGCHGATLVGGISGVSCSSASFNGLSCHASGPHPVPWPAHNSVQNQQNNCSPCHGASLAGGKVAPACSKCHVQLLPGTVPLLGSCISCHSTPPDGAVFPNISAAHNAHVAVGLSCATCHLGGGSGTALHGTVLTTAFPASYNAKTGSVARNADNSCVNVSCHGGKRTPLWRGGRIDPLNECISCHESGPAAGTPQANSYYSGEHGKHLVEIGLFCTDCHDMKVVSGSNAHFSGLNTPAFELSPALTIRTPLSYNVDGSGVRSCSPGTAPPAGSFSIGVCHAQKNW